MTDLDKQKVRYTLWNLAKIGRAKCTKLDDGLTYLWESQGLAYHAYEARDHGGARNKGHRRMQRQGEVHNNEPREAVTEVPQARR